MTIKSLYIEKPSIRRTQRKDDISRVEQAIKHIAQQPSQIRWFQNIVNHRKVLYQNRRNIGNINIE